MMVHRCCFASNCTMHPTNTTTTKAAKQAIHPDKPASQLPAHHPVSPSLPTTCSQLKQLQEMFLFDWATMPVQNFVPKLGAAWAGFFLLLGLPVSAFTFDVHKELVQCLAAASAGSSFVVTVLVWRLYLVGRRVVCGVDTSGFA